MTNSSTYSFPFEKLPLRNQAKIEGSNSALYFSHPKVNGGQALVIKTGADSVKWGYNLNVRRIPTYGGEVIQILSMFAQQMSVSGKTRNYKEQAEIYDYFREYLKVAGGFGRGAKSFDRVSTPITFSYPARGWSFDIIVTDLKNMRMALDVVAPEWGFTAEIVSENDRYELGNALLTGMQAVLNSALIRNTNTKTGVIGYDPSNPFSAPSSTDLGQLGTDINERLQQQIGSWATGDLTDYLFQTAVGQAQDNGFKTPADYYQRKFGSNVAFTIGGSGNGTGTTDGESLRSLSGTLKPVQIAALASQGFKNKGYNDAALDKNILTDAVRIAHGESSWTTKAIHHNTSGDDPPNPTYDEYISKYANKQPNADPTVESFDLGLWQINTIHKDARDKQNRKVKDNHALLLDDPLYNAEIMASISQGGTDWGSWVAYKKASSSANSTDIKTRSAAAVDKFLLNPDLYLGTVGDQAPLSASGQEAITKLQGYINSGRLVVMFDNDKKGIMDGTGVVVRKDGQNIQLFDRLLICIAYLLDSTASSGTKIQTNSWVGDHHRESSGQGHWNGRGVDIGYLDGINLKDSRAKETTIAILKLLNNMKPDASGTSMIPPRIICYGNGELDPDVYKYVRLFKDTGLNANYTKDEKAQHQDHIHIGYNYN